MAQTELFKTLKQRQQDSKNILEKENEELKFFDRFFINNSLNGFDNIVKINYTDFAIAYVMSQITNKEDRAEVFEVLYNGFESIRDLLDDMTEEELSELLCICKQLKETDCTLIAIDIFKDPNKHRGKFSLRKTLVGKAIDQEVLDELLDIHEPTSSNIGTFIELYEKLEYAFITAIYLIGDIKNLKDSYDSFLKALEVYGPNSKERKIFIANYQDEYDFTEINKDFRCVRDHYEHLKSEDRTVKKSSQREFNNYQLLEQKLVQALQKDEVTDAVKMLSKIQDEELRLQVLKLVYLHNQEYYERLVEEYNELSKNSSIKYQAILTEHDLDGVDVATIMNNSLEDVKMMICKLKSFNIKDKKIITTILQISNRETFELITGYINQGLLKPSFIMTKPLIFSSSSEEYQRFIINMKLFKEIGFNPNYLNNSQEILIEDSNLIGRNIEILKTYGFEKSLRRDIDYKFLTQEDLMLQLDKALELGLEEYLEEDLSILNYHSKFDRIRVMQMLNIPFDTKEELIECLTTTQFLIKDEVICDYLDMINPKEITMDSIPDDITILKQYQKTQRVYDVNGVLLSKKRIERNYSESEGIENRALYSILHESILSKTYYRTLKETFNQTLTYK